MNVFTIGFTQKTAQDFFDALIQNNVKTVIDVRLNNTSQLAGFAKGKDLQYFLNNFCKIDYYHDLRFSPPKSLLDAYKKKEVDWQEYENIFKAEMEKRKLKDYIKKKYKDKDNVCLLCSEPLALKCHRRLIAEYFLSSFSNVKIINL